jgi:hypothetical protein
MAFPQEHETTKLRNSLKVFFFVLSWFRDWVGFMRHRSIPQSFQIMSCILERRRSQTPVAQAIRTPAAEHRRSDEMAEQIQAVRGAETVSIVTRCRAGRLMRIAERHVASVNGI